MPSAFVTGGSGFIGGRLIRRLVADGWTVRALARSESSAAKVRDAGAEPVMGDLDDVAAMADGARGCEYAFHAAADAGRVVLAVCGGYQLLGHHYQLGEERIPGVGLVDLHTVREDGPRLIGNVAIQLADGQVLAGFENHGGRTHLGPGARPLGRVLKGHGNTGASGFEGVRRGTVIGTYLHGPLLPKNAWFADWLIASALGLDAPLAPLDDAFEDAAHASARRAAGV